MNHRDAKTKRISGRRDNYPKASLRLCVSVVGFFLFFVSKGSVQTASADRKALILYDGPSTGYSEGLISARSIANLLGHFSASHDIQTVGDYQSGQVENYAWIFFAGNVEKTRLPNSFLDDLAATTKTICWLNRHVNQLIANSQFSQKAGFRFDGSCTKASLSAKQTPTLI
jgi:uncharacterized protein YdaL